MYVMSLIQNVKSEEGKVPSCLPLPHVLTKTDVFCAPKIWPIQACLINGILQHLVRLLSMRIRFISVVECTSSLSCFLLINNIQSVP